MPSKCVGMKSCAWVVWLAGCWLTSGSLTAVFADDTLSKESAAEIQALLQQLGDDSYALREAASDKILKFGLPALQLVEASAKNPDREIRYRCERVLAVLRDLDLQQRSRQCDQRQCIGRDQGYRGEQFDRREDLAQQASRSAQRRHRP